MKKTLLVTNDFPPHLGGIETFLEGFARVLDPEHLIVYTSRRARTGIENYDASTPWTTYRNPSRILLPTPATRHKMQQLINHHNIENVWFGASVPLAFLSNAARKAGAKKIITSTHGDELTWTASALGRAALRSAFAQADVITYISRAMINKLERYIPASTTTIHLPGGIDTEHFSFSSRTRTEIRQHYKLDDNTPVVICVGRSIPGKGQDMLIRAWDIVHRHYPAAILFIVGSGPYNATLKKLAYSSPAHASIVFTGDIPHDTIHRYYCLADIFAMPCRERLGGLSVEGLGITYLEAGASSLPVVVGKAGGAPETIIEGRTGYSVDGTSPRDIANVLIDLISLPDKGRSMGEVGAKWLRENWNWQYLAQPLVSVLS